MRTTPYISTFSGLVSRFSTQVGTLSGRDNLEALVGLLVALREFQGEIAEMVGDLQAEIYDSMPAKEVELTGTGVVTRFTAKSEKWDNEDVVRRLKVLAADGNGEYDAQQVLEQVLKAAQIAYWRKGDLPFKPDDECISTTWGARRIKVV